MIINNKIFCHTHSLAIYCAKKSGLYDSKDFKILIINQVIDWANEITIKIAPSIRAVMREKNIEKFKRLRIEFIKNDLIKWFGYLENLLNNFSLNKKFFTDKFSIADITAWRVITWFTSGKLDMIDKSFLKEFPVLKSYFSNLNSYKPLIKLKEYRSIVESD